MKVPFVSYLFLLIALMFVALQAYVRFAPTKAADWHVDPFAVSAPRMGGALVTGQDGRAPDVLLAALAQAAGATARTEVIAGSLEEGRMTFVTRSGFWGFPDYTTIATRPATTEATGSDYALFGRLRFGRKDFDVNAKRLATWQAIAGL